jgi:hypothetical protein
VYVLGVGLLVAVAIFGVTKKGARRWLNVGIVIQPSEILKIAVPLMLAWWFQKREGQLRKLEREELGLLGQLEALEAEKLKLDTALSTPEVYSQGELAKSIVLQLDANRVLREQIQDRWEVVALEMEEVQAEMRR